MDWVNVTVGVRTTYVRDMATARPPLLDELARVRPMVRGPLLVSHAFRAPRLDRRSAGRRRRPGRHGAPADRRPRPPAQALRGPRATRSGRASPATRTAARSTRCCSAPSTPTWRLRGSRGGPPRRSSSRRDLERLTGGRVAVVGAGPAGLECALSARPRGRARRSSLFEAADHIGGQLAIAAAAPNRVGLGAAAGLLRARAPARGRRAAPRNAGAGAGRLRCGRPGHRRRGDRAGGRARRRPRSSRADRRR